MIGLRIFVVDDDPATGTTLAKVLAAEGHDVSSFTSGDAARGALEDTEVDVLVTDVVMSPVSGLELLDYVVAEKLSTAVMLVTGFGDIPSAVQAVQRGAYDYLPKPVDVERLCVQVTKAGHQARLERENRDLKERLAVREAGRELLGDAPAMRELRDSIARAAASDATVLITGESGVGKELVARSLYRAGDRAEQPFVAVNCAAIPATLVESEFFGHERGAFTGAVKRRRGRFEAANGGTLFLDEIGDIEPAVQVKLLRVLQERRFERVGGSDSIETDVRVIAATRFDLSERLHDGGFREDLYYRLAVIHMHVPSLRERRADIPFLVDAFARELGARHGRVVPTLLPEAMGALTSYDWPGNIRELRNCVEGLVVMARRENVRFEDLPLQFRGGAASARPLRALADIEREAILDTLARVGGNRSEAARTLGIGLKTLYRRLHDYGVIGDADSAHNA